MPAVSPDALNAVTAYTLQIGVTRLDRLMNGIDGDAVETLLGWVADPKRWESRSSMKFWANVFTVLCCHATVEQIERMVAPAMNGPYPSDMRELLDRVQPFVQDVVRWRTSGRSSEADLTLPLPKKKAEVLVHIQERLGDPAWNASQALVAYTAKTRMSLQTEEGLALIAALLIHGDAKDLVELVDKAKAEPPLLPVLALHGIEVADEEAERAALLGRIAQTPDDDGPIQVFTDWLLERNDPRGAFIQAQLAGEHPPVKTKDLKAWAGDVAELLRVTANVDLGQSDRRLPVYRRGVLSGCCVETLDGTSSSAPEWATVRVLDVVKSIAAIDKYTLPSLKVIGGLHSRDLPVLLNSPLAAQIEGIGIKRVLKGDLATYLDRLNTLPRLRFFTFQRSADIVGLLDHPLLQRLELLLHPPRFHSLEHLSCAVDSDHRVTDAEWLGMYDEVEARLDAS